MDLCEKVFKLLLCVKTMCTFKTLRWYVILCCVLLIQFLTEMHAAVKGKVNPNQKWVCTFPLLFSFLDCPYKLVILDGLVLVL